MSDESYPDDLHYNEAHDWVRVEGDIATFGITWYAQDTLGEVVYFSPPEVGDDGHEGRRVRRAGVDQGRVALVAPLSGEVVDGERGAGRQREHGQRRSLRRGLAGQGADSRSRPSSTR